MGKSQSKSKSSNPSSVTSGKSSVIAKGTRIKGKFTSTENIRVDGIIEGDVDCQQRLIIGKEGKVDGTINAQELKVQGEIVGDVLTQGKISISSTTVLKGNIKAQGLEVEEGAIIDGNITISHKD